MVLYVKAKKYIKELEDKIKKLGGDINRPIKLEIDIENSCIQYKAGTEEMTKVTDDIVEIEAEM